MPIWYNPLGTRAVIDGVVQLAAGASTIFGFNGIVHFSWPAAGPSQAFFEFSFNGGITWVTLITFNVGDVAESVMVATGITRVRRAAVGVGTWPITFGGWRFQ